MATGLVCNLPSNFDKEYSKAHFGFPAQRVADIRANLETEFKRKNPEKEYVDPFAVYNDDTKRLMEDEVYKIRKQTIEKAISRGNSKIATLIKIKLNTTAKQREEAINTIATWFSEEVDRELRGIKFLHKDSTVTREELVTGKYVENGNRKSEFSILDRVLNRFYSFLNANKDNPAKAEAVSLCKEIINNWGGFISMARRDIMLRESILSENEIDASELAQYENFLESREDFNPEEETHESWQQSSEERDPFASVGTRVRRLLSSLPVYHTEIRKGDIVEVKDETIFGASIYMKASKAHKELLIIARSTNSAEELYGKLMEEYSSGRSFLKPIIDACNQDSYFKTLLYTDLKRNFQWYSGVSKDKKGKLKDTILNSERTQVYLSNIVSRLIFSPESLVQEDIEFIRSDNPDRKYDKNKVAIKEMVFGEDGKILPEGVKAWKAEVFDLFSNIENVKNEETGKTEDKRVVKLTKFNALDSKNGVVTQRVLELHTLLTAVGIRADVDSLSYIIKKGKIRHLAQQIINLAQYAFTPTYESQKAANIPYYSVFQFDSEGTESKFSEYYKKIIKILNENSLEINKLYKVRTKNSRGKTSDRFSDVNPSYLGTLLEKIETFQSTNDKEGLKEFLMTEFFYDPAFAELDENLEPVEIYNPILRDLWNQATSSKTMEVTVDGVNESLYTGNTVSENMSEKVHAVTEIAKFFSPYVGNGKAWYPVFILGDSNKLKYIVGKKYNDNEKIYKELYSLYKREIKQAQVFESLNEQLKKQGYKDIEWIKRNDKLSLLQTLQPYFDSIGLKYTNPKSFITSEEEFIAIAKRYIEGDKEAGIRGSAFESLDYYKKIGVFEKISDKENAGYAALSGIDGFPTSLDSDKFNEKWINFYLNRKLNMAAQLNILDIDTRIIPNSKELQKRNKQNSAPGTPLDVEATFVDGTPVFSEDEPRVQRVIYFKDINADLKQTDPDFMQVVKNTFGENSDIYENYAKGATLTDGQGYRTLDSYRKVMTMAGKWSDQLEDAYQKIVVLRNNNNISKEDRLNSIKNAAAIFQPIKPFMYTHEQIVYGENGEVATIPVQLKYAEAVLIPELQKDGSLKELAEWMEKNNVDLACSTKCVKCGEFGAVDISKAKAKGELTKILNDGFLEADEQTHKLGIHVFNFEDYRIQTNVPPHVDQSRSIGTQIRKLIMSDLVLNEDHRYDFYFKETGMPKMSSDTSEEERNNMTGRRLTDFYNSLIISNILSAFDRFEKTVSNNKKLSKVLQKTVLQNDRVSIDALISFGITQDEKFLVPLFEPSLEHDTVAEILSIFRKDVNKQKMNGGSAVQVSAYGIQGYNESDNLKVITNPEKDNIIAAECEIPFIASYVDNLGITRNLEFSDYCNEDGTLILEEGVPKIERDFPGILDIIAYRVPTERNYSVIRLKVVRFSPPQAGGTIKVPAQFTKIAGFDFDIDKLYFLRKEFRAVGVKPNFKEHKELVQSIWEEVYAGRYNGGTYDSANYTKLRIAQDRAFKATTGISEKKFREKNPLYKFWEDAGLPGTAQEAFEAYLAENPSTKKALNTLPVKAYEWDKYKADEYPENQSTTARNNMLLHIMQQRWSDKETIKSRLKPGGFDISKHSARILRELTLNSEVNSLSEALAHGEIEDADPEPSYDPTDPQTMLIYNQLNQVAGKLIGIFANQNINHALASLAQTLELRVPIAFNGHPQGLFDLLHNNEIDTFQTVAEFLAASVDAVKDPVLNYLNFNTYTANAAGLLARLGYMPLEIGLLFNQPIIKEVCEKAQNDNMSSIQMAIASIRKKYAKFGNTKGVFNEIETLTQASSEALASYIIKSNKFHGEKLMSNKEMADIQFKILNLFEDIINAADELNDFIGVTRFTAANSVGSSFGDIYAQQEKVEQYLKKLDKKDSKGRPTNYFNIQLSENTTMPITPINRITKKEGITDITEYLKWSKGNPFAYEQCMFDCNRKLTNMTDKIVPYETPLYTRLRNFASKFVTTKLGRLKAETTNNLHTQFITYYLSNLEGGMWDGEAQMNEANQLYKHKKSFKREYYYRYKFAQDYAKFARENDFDRRYPELSKAIKAGASKVMTDFEGSIVAPKEEYVVVLNTVSSRGQDSIRQDVADAIKEEIEQMAVDFPNAAYGLYFYNFFKMDHTFGGNSLLSWFPTSMLASLPVGIDSITGEKETYVDVLNSILNGDIGFFDGSYDYNDYIRQFILNNLEDNSFTYFLNKEAAEEFSLKSKGKDTVVLSSKNDIKEEGVFNPIIGFKEDGKTPIWAPIIAITKGGETVYYMANNNSDTETGFNVGESIQYIKVEPLGEYGQSVRYGTSVESARGEMRILESRDEISNNDIVGNVDMEDSQFSDFRPEDIIDRLKIKESEDYVEARTELLAEQMLNSKEPLISDSGEQVCGG